MYCSNCGAQIDDRAVICPKCGVPTKNYQHNPQIGNSELPPGRYDWLTTLLLCFFLGVFGVHNFYTKKTGIAVAQLLTLGGCGIWSLVDFIMILTEAYRDGNGNPLVRR
jgi:TM2 domain/zinc-ribbon domain